MMFQLQMRRCENYNVIFLLLSAISCPKAEFGALLWKVPHSPDVTIYWLEFNLQPCKESFLGAPLCLPIKFWRASPYGGIIPVGNPVLSMPMGNSVEYTANISIIIALRQDKWSLKKKKSEIINYFTLTIQPYCKLLNGYEFFKNMQYSRQIFSNFLTPFRKKWKILEKTYKNYMCFYMWTL